MSRAQIGVVFGMAAALLATVAIFTLAPGLPTPAAFAPTLEGRLRLAAAAALGPLASLVVTIGVVANRRFFSAADIDGAGLTDESPAVRIARAVLANTAEQALLAVPIYAGLALTAPARELGLPLALACAFVVGRLFFALGYARGAAARSFGFALTFYPLVGGLLALAVRLLPALVR
jgi:hypothetical protein